MSNYVEINNGSKIIINDEYKNISLVKKLTSFTVQQDNATYYILVSMSGASLLTLNCNSPNFAFYVQSGVSTSIIGVIGLNGANPLDVVNYLTVYLFGFQSISATSGLEIRNANGNVVYNSNQKYMRMLSSVKYGQSVFSVNNFSHKIAILPTQTIAWHAVESGGHMEVNVVFICYYFPTVNSFQATTDLGYSYSDIRDDQTAGISFVLIANVDNL